MKLSEPYTTQRCLKCGEKGNRDERVFKCSEMEVNSDLDVALSIFSRALGKPEIRSMPLVQEALWQVLNSIAMT